MLAIVGGSYFEFCREPRWSEFYGSGLRAAAAVSGLKKSVSFLTYCDDESLIDLEAAANTFGIELRHEARAQKISFNYHHPFSIPTIAPFQISPSEDLHLSADNVLRFGFLEGQAVVTADRAVYDPQSPGDPRPFKENGSKAKHLAIVANSREARLMSGKEDLVEIGRTLLASEGAEVVIVKCGPLGCRVFTSTSDVRIPVFETDHVWPIGSGDIFAAVFAHYWAECGVEASEAARLSSMYTAFYCNSKSLPLPTSLAGFSPPAIMLDTEDLKLAQIYLAGPFFSMPERWMIEETRSVLRSQGLKVFSPFHDVGRGPASKVAPADVKGIEESSVMFALLDGRDAGTIFEVGYARKKDIPVIGLAENLGDEDLKMFIGTDCRVVDDFATAIYKTVWSTKNR
jgi:nucleoside 2-deoxyribosyltransferase